MSALLEAHSINFSYPSVRVLTDVSLTIGKHESHVIIGPNGAGKTTLFKVLSGEIFPQSGSITYKGNEITNHDGYQRVGYGIGRTFQVARLFTEQTVLDNILLALECRERNKNNYSWWRLNPKHELIDEAYAILSKYGMQHRVHNMAAYLSHGDKKRLELLVTLAQKPKLIMLDEPTAGMAPADRRGVIDMINQLRDLEGITLLLTEHDMDVVFGLATKLTVLNQGEIIASGDPITVRQDPIVNEIYFGRSVKYA